MKMMTFLAIGAMMLSLSAPAMAMGNKPSAPDAGSTGGGGGSFSSTANDLGNNDGVQQAAGDIGAAIAKGGQALNDQAYQFGNQNPNIPYDKVKSMAQTGTNVFAAGKTIEYAGKAAPHVGWVATSAGYAAEGQYKGATVQAVNGVTRTVTVAKVGSAVATAGGIWATDLARSINWEGSVGLLNAAQNIKRIKRFIFASTCSNYGKMEGDNYITEDSPLKPISLYAELKVQFEQYLLQNDYRAEFCPTALRFATVYGLSPRMRFDLTVNEFTRDAALGRELVIFGEQFWRPYCIVEDLANACILVLESEPEKVNKNVFNVGDTKENYQKKMLAVELKKLVPDLVVKYVQKIEDPRDYKVSFEKIKNELGFKITKTVPEGMKEIIQVLRDGIISDPDNPRYSNI